MSIQMIAPEVKNVPWQERPENLVGAPIWRYKENPIINRNPIPGVARIFNSAVVPYEDGFIGVFRGEQTNGVPYIYLGWSQDAIHWDFEPNKIPFVDEEGKSFMPIYAYDPRLVKVEDTYYIIWCQDFYGAAIGIVQAGRQGDKETYVLDASYVTDIEIGTLSLDSRAYSEIGIRKLLPSDPDIALAYVMIKQSTATSEQYGKLLEDFMLQFPDNPDGLFNMGSYLIQETDSTQFARGIELIEKSISVAEDKDRLHCDYANLIYNTIVGRLKHPDSWTLEKALEEINAALSINETALYLQLQGNILYAMKRYPEAFDSFMKLNSTDQSSTDTYLFAYTVRRQIDSDPDICISLLDSALAKFGTPLPQRAASLILERATIKEDAGRNREAVADYNLYEQMLGANAMSSTFYFIREQVEIKARMFEQALADINQARLLAPQDSSLMLEHASLLLRIGNFEAALPILKDLEVNYPDQPDIQRLIGVCYMRRKDDANARKYLTRAKELGDEIAAQLLEE